MARPKEFDENQVLEKAMEVFWHKGYEAASMQDLVSAMGINRQSIYDTFGDKHALFLTTLERYFKEAAAEMLPVLDKPGSQVDNIRNFYLGAIERCQSNQKKSGCFLVNTAIEMAPHCPKTAQKISQIFTQMENALCDAIKRGQSSGEFNKDQDPQALAKFLQVNLQGMMVMSKVNASRDILNQLVETTLSTLK